jgi:hypothetical protein
MLFGCSRSDYLAGYARKFGDLGAFIVQQASKCGAHLLQTNGLPQFTASWRYKEDGDGFQVYIVGDRLAPLQALLTAAFGPPAHPLKTNEVAGTKHIGTYYGADLGAGLTYGWSTTRAGEQFTSMVVVRQKR